MNPKELVAAFKQLIGLSDEKIMQFFLAVCKDITVLSKFSTIIDCAVNCNYYGRAVDFMKAQLPDAIFVSDSDAYSDDLIFLEHLNSKISPKDRFFILPARESIDWGEYEEGKDSFVFDDRKREEIIDAIVSILDLDSDDSEEFRPLTKDDYPGVLTWSVNERGIVLRLYKLEDAEEFNERIEAEAKDKEKDLETLQRILAKHPAFIEKIAVEKFAAK